MIIFIIKTLIAIFRLNKRIVCEMSINGRDYHDYKDSIDQKAKSGIARCSGG